MYSWTMREFEERKVKQLAYSSPLSTPHALLIMVLTLSVFLTSSKLPLARSLGYHLLL
jgi:hypothetical protein